MQTDKCKSVRGSILDFLSHQTIVEEVGGLCVATIPIPTVDGRFVDIYIEKKLGDYVLVHDGGKAANELIMQGMDITDAVHRDCSSLAQSFRVHWNDEMFQVACKSSNLTRAIMGVAACSSLATFQLVGHQAIPEEEPIRDQFGVALKKWARKKATVTDHFEIEGKVAQHSFDFVVTPKRAHPVAISVLLPTGGARSAAERFGFKISDLEGTEASKWKKLAVEAKAENWTPYARRIVNAYADHVIEINVDKKPTQDKIDEAMAMLAA